MCRERFCVYVRVYVCMHVYVCEEVYREIKYKQRVSIWRDENGKERFI